MKKSIWVLLGMIYFMPGCASNPMKSRLEKNFVYQCSLQLLEKNVNAADAEKVCSASHRAEMEERGIQSNHNRTPAAVPAAPSSGNATTHQ